MIVEPRKRCTKCGQVKLLTEFYVQSNGRGWRGRRADCKTCRKLHVGTRRAVKNGQEYKPRPDDWGTRGEKKSARVNVKAEYYRLLRQIYPVGYVSIALKACKDPMEEKTAWELKCDNIICGMAIAERKARARKIKERVTTADVVLTWKQVAQRQRVNAKTSLTRQVLKGTWQATCMSVASNYRIKG